VRSIAIFVAALALSCPLEIVIFRYLTPLCTRDSPYSLSLSLTTLFVLAVLRGGRRASFWNASWNLSGFWIVETKSWNTIKSSVVFALLRAKQV